MKWEYWVTVLPAALQTDLLNSLGLKGWELIAVVGDTGYLKRPVEPKPPDILIVNVSDRDIDDIAQQIKEAMADRA